MHTAHVGEQQVENAVAKGRELAMKLSEREKVVSTLRAQIAIGERDYERDKAQLETQVLELDARRQQLQLQIAQRRSDVATITASVDLLQDTDKTVWLNRAVSFVPKFPKS